MPGWAEMTSVLMVTPSTLMVAPPISTGILVPSASLAFVRPSHWIPRSRRMSAGMALSVCAGVDNYLNLLESLFLGGRPLRWLL